MSNLRLFLQQNKRLMKIKSFLMITLSTSLLACSSKQNTLPPSSDTPVIGRSKIEITDGIMTPEVLYSFGRISDVQVAHKTRKILYGVTYIGIEENKTNRELFTMNIDGSDKQQITQTSVSEQNAIWVKNDTKIAFLSNETGVYQIWEMNPDGSNREQISDIDGDVTSFNYSPDGQKILFVKNVKSIKKTAEIHPDLPKASGKIIDDMMYKHWDQWVEEIPHPFIADFDGRKLSNIIDIMQDEPFESPMLPMGGIEQLSWTPDGKNIAYTSRKKIGREYALSTNSDIYLYNLENKQTKNLTKGMMGYDINPTFSPNGRYMAWQSMERDGYESDKNRLMILDLTTGQKQDVTENFDYNIDYVIWDTDQSLYAIASVKGTTQIFQIYFQTKEIKPVTKGVFDYESIALGGRNMLVALRHSMSKPNEIYLVDATNGEAKELSFENKEILEQLTMGRVEERWIETTDGKQMLTWIIYPPNFDPNQKYPALLYCQGGPQSMVSQFWSYRWNLQMMAANGYIVVAPNRRGLPGFGQEWNEQISGDYGGQNMKDYLSAIDAVAKEPFIDSNRLGCTGASYGGFSTYWLAGNHNKRFKAFLAHAGIFNLEAQYLETEEMWFANWDLGGSFWDKNNKTALRSYESSPHKFVDQWDTPIMITHGEKDYRILASQGMMAFNAAQLKGIPSRMLIFPDENHWISQPQNGVLFQREFMKWFDHWLK